MKSLFLISPIICLTVTSSALSQQPKQPRKDDLPDVSLVIPEEARPEVKAIIKANAAALRSAKAAERSTAAQVLGELGEAGKPARGLLCRAMLDSVPSVRVAAADALKNIDAKMQYLAVALMSEKETDKLRDLLGKIQKLQDDGEPLATLVAQLAIVATKDKNMQNLIAPAMTTLSHIARNDQPSYKLIASALGNLDENIRVTALHALPRMKHGKLAVPKIIAILKQDTLGNRVAAIEALTALADESTEETIAVAIKAQRYHENEIVRNAVETALNKLENKKKP